MRLFVAIDFSPEVVEVLLRAANVLRRQGMGNFTRRENLHLTLAFLGETERVEAASDAVMSVKADTFPLTLEKLGHFRDLYWAGVRPSTALTALQRQVAQALTDRGFTLEDRPFRPHLTLCREFRPFASSFTTEAAEKALGTPSCIIRRVRLMQSRREKGRLIYSEVCGKNLGHAGE